VIKELLTTSFPVVAVLGEKFVNKDLNVLATGAGMFSPGDLFTWLGVFSFMLYIFNQGSSAIDRMKTKPEPSQTYVRKDDWEKAHTGCQSARLKEIELLWVKYNELNKEHEVMAKTLSAVDSSLTHALRQQAVTEKRLDRIIERRGE
jgi:hypothetical protein